MSATTAYESLEDLVTATLADFARCGIDSLAKLALLEAAWSQSLQAEIPESTALCLQGHSAETLRILLEQLVMAGLLERDGDGYRLSENPLYSPTLTRLRTFWSDRELHARAAPLLRYRSSTH